MAGWEPKLLLNFRSFVDKEKSFITFPPELDHRLDSLDLPAVAVPGHHLLGKRHPLKAPRLLVESHLTEKHLVDAFKSDYCVNQILCWLHVFRPNDRVVDKLGVGQMSVSQMFRDRKTQHPYRIPVVFDRQQWCRAP
jgi:hypothetical protein